MRCHVRLHIGDLDFPSLVGCCNTKATDRPPQGLSSILNRAVPAPFSETLITTNLLRVAHKAFND